MSYCHDHVIIITRYVTSRHKCWPTSLVSGNHITHNLILICHVIMSSENKNVWFNLIYLLWPCKFPFTYHVVMQCSLSQCKKVFLPSEHVLNVGVYSLGEFMILQKFELCKVQLTHGENIHGNEKLYCLGSTGRSRSQIKSFTVCFLYDSISTPGLVQELADDV